MRNENGWLAHIANNQINDTIVHLKEDRGSERKSLNSSTVLNEFLEDHSECNNPLSQRGTCVLVLVVLTPVRHKIRRRCSSDMCHWVISSSNRQVHIAKAGLITVSQDRLHLLPHGLEIVCVCVWTCKHSWGFRSIKQDFCSVKSIYLF